MSCYYNEIDPYAAQWLRNLIAAGHIAPGDVDERSIEDVQPDDVRGYTQCHFFAGIGGWSYALRLAGWPDDRPVWTGSCPCQPFSSAGKGAGFADSRHLWPTWFRLIGECAPPVLFGEQVASAAGWAWFDTVSTDLEGAAYAVGAADVPAAGVGAFHIRQRMWWVAHAQRGTAERRRHDVAGAARGTESEARQRERVRAESGASGTVGIVAHTYSQSGESRHGRCGKCRIGANRKLLNEFGGGGSLGELGNACGAGLQGRTDQELRRTGRGQEGRGAASASVWDAVEWLPCRDGKARPTEPGLFPLAHGVSGRVGRLRAYGNAIVPAAAAEFISAYLDAVTA